MRFDAQVVKTMLRPAWLALIVGSALLAGLSALWVGLQQEAGETSTTFVFARRVGYLDRPIPVLDDHLNEIINSVEFPVVFERIEDRLLLEESSDYDLTIGLAESTQSVVEIKVQTERPGDADRIARIVAEEMVDFVLDTQDVSIVTEITDFDDELVRLREDQVELIDLAGGVPPTTARRNLEGELAAIIGGDVEVTDDDYESVVREELSSVSSLSTQYERNASAIRGLERLRARAVVERIDITSNQESINDEWYRQVTPVEKTSNVPLAVAMAFAAAVPSLFVAAALVFLNVSRRVAVERRREAAEAEQRNMRSGALRV